MEVVLKRLVVISFNLINQCMVEEEANLNMTVFDEYEKLHGGFYEKNYTVISRWMYCPTRGNL